MICAAQYTFSAFTKGNSSYFLKPQRSYGSQNHLYLVSYGLFYYSGVLILILVFTAICTCSNVCDSLKQRSSACGTNVCIHYETKICHCFREKKQSHIACFCLNLKENLLVVMDIKLQSYVLARRSPNGLFKLHPSAESFFFSSSFLCRELQS